MTATRDRFVEDYLKRLESELAGLPRGRRRELLDEIREHIEEARSGLETQSEAQIRALLDRIGEPEEIAEEARERFGIRPARAGTLEVTALVLLLIGGVIIPVIGWLAGVGLLWASAVWTKRDKLIGTFLMPGGLTLPVYWLIRPWWQYESCGSNAPEAPFVCSGPSAATVTLAIGALVLFVVVSLATTVYLGVRLRR